MLLRTFPPSARLSGFVDTMALQVGNAVPSLLAQRIAEMIIELDQQADQPSRAPGPHGKDPVPRQGQRAATPRS
jgi:hypothetical protein